MQLNHRQTWHLFCHCRKISQTNSKGKYLCCDSCSHPSEPAYPCLRSLLWQKKQGIHLSPCRMLLWRVVVIAAVRAARAVCAALTSRHPSGQCSQSAEGLESTKVPCHSCVHPTCSPSLWQCLWRGDHSLCPTPCLWFGAAAPGALL